MALQLTEVMKSNPPRLVVEYDPASKNFRWGVVGTIPVLTLIGGVVGAQQQLIGSSHSYPINTCDQSALVITYGDETDTLECFVNTDIPTDPLVGMMEVVKTMLVNSRLAQMAASNVSPIIGPNGHQIRRS